MRVCFWATTFQSDIQALAYHLATQPDMEVLVALEHPRSYAAEAITHIAPFAGRVIDRSAADTRTEIERFDADVVIIDNHVPPYRIAPRTLVVWHGFGWRVDDLSQMRRELRRHVGDVTRSNDAFRWQAFGEWDRRYRIDHSQLAPDNVIALGSPYSDWLLPDSPMRARFDRQSVQLHYDIDLSRPTVLVAMTWHHGGPFAQWGDDAALFDRLLRHIDGCGANALIRMHDRHRYDEAYADALERSLEGRANVELKWKSEAPDSYVDLLVSDVMISNYSSILNGFYHTQKPTLHVDPADVQSKPQYYRRWKSGRLQKVRVSDPASVWKLDPDENGGLRVRSFDELLEGVELALADPSCCRERARAFCERYISAADGSTCDRVARMLRAWCTPSGLSRLDALLGPPIVPPSTAPMTAATPAASGAPAKESASFDHQLTRGALVNVLGLLAKLIQPLLFVLLTWMFGPTVMGVYFLTTSIGDMAMSAVTSGYVDATMIYGSHHVDRAGEDEEAARTLYQVLGNAFVFALGTSMLCIVLAQLGSDWLVARLYPAHPEVAPALRLLAWSLPFAAFATTAVSATKIHMRMEYDAGIMGFGRPLLQLIGCMIVWLAHGGLVGLMAATLCTQIAVASIAMWAFLRHFDGWRALAATLRPKFHRPMLEFAIPQSLNMTLNKYITRLDVVLLAKFGQPAHMLAYYSTAALITSNLREVKLIFSSALAPVAARYHGAGERAMLEQTLGRVSRWTTTLIVPLLILVVVLRDDVLQIVSKTYTHGATFMVLLLVPPFLSCAFGLAGNLVTYAGRSGWTLTNSALIAVLNTGLCTLLIPRYGLLGAALATALAMTMISSLQMLELRWLEGVAIRLRAVYKPHVGLIVVAFAVAALWDPASLPGLPHRIATALGLIGLYGSVLYLLRHEELLALLARLRGPRGVA